MAILLASLMGLSFLSGLIAFLAGTTNFHFLTTQDAGKVFYGWVLALEILFCRSLAQPGFHARSATTASRECGTATG